MDALADGRALDRQVDAFLHSLVLSASTSDPALMPGSLRPTTTAAASTGQQAMTRAELSLLDEITQFAARTDLETRADKPASSSSSHQPPVLAVDPKDLTNTQHKSPHWERIKELQNKVDKITKPQDPVHLGPYPQGDGPASAKDAAQADQPQESPEPTDLFDSWLVPDIEWATEPLDEATMRDIEALDYLPSWEVGTNTEDTSFDASVAEPAKPDDVQTLLVEPQAVLSRELEDGEILSSTPRPGATFPATTEPRPVPKPSAVKLEAVSPPLRAPSPPRSHPKRAVPPRSRSPPLRVVTTTHRSRSPARYPPRSPPFLPHPPSRRDEFWRYRRSPSPVYRRRYSDSSSDGGPSRYGGRPSRAYSPPPHRRSSPVFQPRHDDADIPSRRLRRPPSPEYLPPRQRPFRHPEDPAPPRQAPPPRHQERSTKEASTRSWSTKSDEDLYAVSPQPRPPAPAPTPIPSSTSASNSPVTAMQIPDEDRPNRVLFLNLSKDMSQYDFAPIFFDPRSDTYKHCDRLPQASELSYHPPSGRLLLRFEKDSDAKIMVRDGPDRIGRTEVRRKLVSQREADWPIESSENLRNPAIRGDSSMSMSMSLSPAPGAPSTSAESTTDLPGRTQGQSSGWRITQKATRFDSASARKVKPWSHKGRKEEANRRINAGF